MSYGFKISLRSERPKKHPETTAFIVFLALSTEHSYSRYLSSKIMAENTQKYHLLIIEDSQGQRVAHLDAATYSIGRDHSDSIQVSDPAVSRHHAVLIRVPLGNQQYAFRVIDGDASGKPSKNGLFINGDRCKSQNLNSNDTLQIGRTAKLTYFIGNFTQEEFCMYCHDSNVKFHRIKEVVLDPTETLYAGLAA